MKGAIGLILIVLAASGAIGYWWIRTESADSVESIQIGVSLDYAEQILGSPDPITSAIYPGLPNDPPVDNYAAWRRPTFQMYLGIKDGIVVSKKYEKHPPINMP